MTDATMTTEIILTEEEKSMTVLHLNEEIICFIKSIFSDIEELERRLENMFQINLNQPHNSRNWTKDMWYEMWDELLDEMKQTGFDGTYHSITYNDVFWDNIITLMNISSSLSLYNKLLDHQFTVIRQDMVPILMPKYNGRICLENNLLDYIEENWTTIFKEPIMEWFQMEYDICCK